MKHQFLPFISLLSFLILIGDTTAQNFEWAKKMGGANSWDRGRSIVVDTSGNVYTTGFFSDTVDFDPGPGTFNLAAAGDQDIFVSKLDATGNFLWAKRMGGVEVDIAYSITLDASGNVYTTGTFEGTADFDPDTGTFNLTAIGSSEIRDIFVSKLDSSGNFIWAKKMGGTRFECGYSIAVDASENVYTTGFFYGTADFDPGPGTFNLTSRGNSDIFISKLDSAGNFIWAKRLGGIGDYERGYSIKVDVMGNVYTTGGFYGTVDFDPDTGTFNLSSAGSLDIFISKLDASGNFIWAKKMGGINDDEGRSIAVDVKGNVYSTGYFGDSADFDPSFGRFNLISAGRDDIFISKLDSTGNFLWAKRMGGKFWEHANSITLDVLGNIYTTGYFLDTVDFNPGTGTYNLISKGHRDIFISKLDSTGGFVWAKQIGGADWDESSSITVDASENIYTTGFFWDTVDFDPDSATFIHTSTGFGDIFVSKWSQCFIDTSITLNNDTLTSNQQSASYQWLNCGSSFNVVSGAIGQAFTPSQNGNYACEVSLNGCVDTTACVQVIVTGIEKNALSEAYKIYPNPFADQITIKSVGVSSNTHLEVININGQVVYEGTTLLNGKTVLNTADWAKGIYFIRLTNEQGVGTFKLAHQ